MVLGKRVEGLRAEVAGEHWPAEGDDVAHGQQARLDSGEIAVAANQQRVALLAGNQSLPVDMRQQATGAVAAAHGEDDPVAAGQLGQLVNIGQPFMFSPGETLLPAGNDLLVGYLVSGLLQTLDAAGCRLLVDAIPGWRDQIKLRHDNSLL